MKNPRKGLALLFILTITIGLYEFFLKKDILKYGVYSKCVITNIEGRKGGLVMTAKYKYKGVVYYGRMGSEGVEKEGKEYFIKLIPSNPKAIVVLSNNPVPSCLLNIDAPEKGWKVMPVCK